MAIDSAPRHNSTTLPSASAIAPIPDPVARALTDGEDLGCRPLSRFLERPAGESFGDRVHEFDAPRRIDGHDRIGNRRKRHLRPLLLLEQQRLRLLALFNVGERAHEALLACCERLLQLLALDEESAQRDSGQREQACTRDQPDDEQCKPRRRLRLLEQEIGEGERNDDDDDADERPDRCEQRLKPVGRSRRTPHPYTRHCRSGGAAR